MARRFVVASIVVVGVAFALAFACVEEPGEEQFRGDVTLRPEAWIPTPLAEAPCEILVEGKGIKDIETDYLPHVITCENGGANLETLKAQAIAARSVAYYYYFNQGSVCDSQGCQVYTCQAQPSALAYQAVEETSGLYLNFNGVLTYGFYVAGDPDTPPPACVGTPNVGTENWVTYNSGKAGNDVVQTELGWVFEPGEPGFGQNRGCMSQWGARCLENDNGASYHDILRFYYGEDMILSQAQGECILDLGGDGDGDGDGDSDTGDDDPSSGDGGDFGSCYVGSLGCDCTKGGGCDPGLLCVDEICTEDPSEGESSSGLSMGFQDDALGDGSVCVCVLASESDGRSGAVLSLGLLALIGLQRRRRG